MPSTLLSIVNRAQNELSLTASSTVIGNTNTEVVQFLALANAVGKELVDQHDWQTLVKEYRTNLVYYQYTGTSTDGSTSLTSMSSITGLSARFMITGTGVPQDTYVSSASGTTVVMSQAADASGSGTTFTFSQTQYTMPSDYDRLVDNTEWDKTQHWVMLGPSTSQQWQFLKSGFISSGPRLRFRVLGGYFQTWPPTGTDDYIGFEYVSNQWVLAAADTVTPSKATFSVDTDTCIFPDNLMVLGIKSKLFQAKAWADPYGPLFERELAIRKAADAGSQLISMAPRLSSVLISQSNIPDSGYGS